MALLTCAVWDTVQNERTKTTKRFFESIGDTVDWNRHRLIVSDNGSCPDTLALYDSIVSKFPRSQVIYNGSNLGTAKAVNNGWRCREIMEHVGKLDNDVVFHSSNWADRLEEVIEADPIIGIAALKRNDLAENPWEPEGSWAKSDIRMLPHKPGDRWMVVERVQHTMGTCWIVNYRLVNVIGFLHQCSSLYGFDDPVYCSRAHAAGFETVFVPNIPIDHIDDGGGGGGAYQSWKQSVAGQFSELARKHFGCYALGYLDLYHGPSQDRPELTAKGREFFAPLIGNAETFDVYHLLSKVQFGVNGKGKEYAYLL